MVVASKCLDRLWEGIGHSLMWCTENWWSLFEPDSFYNGPGVVAQCGERRCDVKGQPQGTG